MEEDKRWWWTAVLKIVWEFLPEDGKKEEWKSEGEQWFVILVVLREVGCWRTLSSLRKYARSAKWVLACWSTVLEWWPVQDCVQQPRSLLRQHQCSAQSMVPICSSSFHIFTGRSRSASNPLLLKLPTSWITSHLHSFIPLFFHLWNKLPHTLQSHSSLQVFKTAVHHHGGGRMAA